MDGFKAIRYDRKKLFTEVKDIPENEYLDKPFVPTLMYRGDIKWEENATDREHSRDAFSIDGDEDAWDDALREECFLELMEEMERVAERNAKLYAAIKGLSDSQRNVVILYYFKNYDQRVISQLLGIDQSNVSRRLNTAMERLRKSLDC